MVYTVYMVCMVYMYIYMYIYICFFQAHISDYPQAARTARSRVAESETGPDRMLQHTWLRQRERRMIVVLTEGASFQSLEFNRVLIKRYNSNLPLKPVHRRKVEYWECATA